jgi:hypothetical protein
MDRNTANFMNSFGDEIAKLANQDIALGVQKEAISGAMLTRAAGGRMMRSPGPAGEGLMAGLKRRAAGAMARYGPATSAGAQQMAPGTLRHEAGRAVASATQVLPKPGGIGRVPAQAFAPMKALGQKIGAALLAQAAPAAEGLAAKLVGVIRKRPVMAAATAAAAGAGAATGVAEVKKKKEETARRREAIRQLLMQRLSEGGYSA